MSSINRIKKGLNNESAVSKRYKSLAAFYLLIELADAFSLTKKDGCNTVLKIYKGVLSTTIEGANISDIVKPLGDWLSSLPKGVWE